MIPPASTVPSGDAQRLGESDQQRGDERSGDRSQPADDGDDEGFGDDREVHAEVGGLARQLQRAGEPGEERAHREYRREEAPLVDTQRAREDAVLGGRAGQHAEARTLEDPPQREQHGRPDGEQEEIVGRYRAAEAP